MKSSTKLKSLTLHKLQLQVILTNQQTMYIWVKPPIIINYKVTFNTHKIPLERQYKNPYIHSMNYTTKRANNS